MISSSATSPRFLGLSDQLIFDWTDELSVSLLLLLLFLPVLRYLFTGWTTRRSEIVGALSEVGVRLYFTQFYPAVPLPETNLANFFAPHYAKRYGRRHYVAPLVLLFVVATFLLVLSSMRLSEFLLRPTPALQSPSGAIAQNFPWVAVSATVGAYMWVVSDFITRSRSRELAPPIIYWAALRFVIAIPTALVFGAVLKSEEVGVTLGFLLGAFPTQTLMAVSRRIANRQLNLGISDSENPQSQFEALQGITPGIRERFQEEGISTILQLAYADPIDLTIRCNFDLNFVADCVSQALAWQYLENDLETARACSLRGAREIRTLICELDAGTPAQQDAAGKVVACLSARIKREIPVLDRVLREIASNPRTAFVYDLWSTPEPKV